MTTQDIFNAVLAFDEATVTARTQAELDAGTDIDVILNDGLISAMDEVGERFSAGELFVPEMLMAAQAMKGGLGVLKPLLAGADTQFAHRGAELPRRRHGDRFDIRRAGVAHHLLQFPHLRDRPTAAAALRGRRIARRRKPRRAAGLAREEHAGALPMRRA